MFTLGRKIDPRNKTNLAIIICTFSAFIAGGLLTTELVSGLYLGGTVFVTWALSRDVDPAHSYSAFVAVFLTLTNLLYIETIENTQILVLFWLILILRAVNGITGKTLTLLDLLLALGFTVFLSFNQENGLYLFIFVLAMAGLYRTGERPKVVLAAGLLAFVLAIVQMLFMHRLSLAAFDEQDPVSLILIASAVLSAIIFWFISRRECKDDQGNQADLRRIFTGQVIYCAAVLLLVFFEDLSINDHLVHLSVLLGSVIHFMWLRIKEAVA
ncbi:hypothetical protein [Alkalibacterium pelagium]|uniref:Uncharacterized protein n=1 Tax=Alkalibacterium pelagium TaxID=426702 RepID=A0A1H7PJ71_9LACT|nr:hypothetical protein [Alkalibacterium pelagium]GEN51648.1 hypothetical protein APE02nite_23130 [Alkalibacterium pelagium]SEL35528.1 hypothetical protein SAMN04488099_1219 [Alkalibacterium pelagium]